MHDESIGGVDRWFLAKLGDILGSHSNSQARATLLEEFNRGSKYRPLIFKFIIQKMDVTTDDIGSEAISFLLSELSREKISRWSRNSLLGSAATECFITERLLPLLLSSQEPLKSNVLRIIEQAGARHGRRYLVEC